MSRTGFEIREKHRTGLVLHACVMVTALLACAMANRMLTPDRLWVQWVGLAWAAGFAFHLYLFQRDTIASMTGRGSALRAERDAMERAAREPPAAEPANQS